MTVMSQKMYEMGAKSDIPKTCLMWILLSHLLALLPHVPHIPVWMTFFSLACLIFRLMVYYQKIQYLSRLVSTVLVISMSVGVIVEYGLQLGPNTAVTLLVMSYSMKLLEMRYRRDAYMQVILGYFVVATEFLFETHWIMVSYLYLVMIIITASLVGLNQSVDIVRPKKTLMMAFHLSWQSIPIMIFLFIFFPRIEPFWSIPVDGNQQHVGLSDSMTPDDIARLGGLRDLVFRAEFSGPIPDQSQLYWRSFVFSDFDGVTWSVHTQDKNYNYSLYNYRNLGIEYKGRPLEYRVLMEPTYQSNLFSLDMPKELLPDVAINRGFSLIRNHPVTQPYGYQLKSYLNAQAQLEGAREDLNIDLKLPLNSNPQTMQLAQEWFAELGGDYEAYIQKILSWFREDDFFYTLKPTQLSGDIVDRFLFDTKEGYCSYYASAFVFMMRSVGIPARVVAGYLGGEINPLGQYVLVHQYMAHAWTEVWLPGSGWVRYDPTSEVAPERIRDGVEDLLANQNSEETARFSMSHWYSTPLFKRVRQSFDYVSFRWRKWVVGYDRIGQAELYNKLFSNFSIKNFLWILGSMCVFVGLFWVMLIWFFKDKGMPIDEAYKTFCLLLNKKGVLRQLSETPQQYAERAKLELPAHAGLIDDVTSIYMNQYRLPFTQESITVMLKKDAKQIHALCKKMKRGIRK